VEAATKVGLYIGEQKSEEKFKEVHQHKGQLL
jgi:hypothetical protein